MLIIMSIFLVLFIVSSTLFLAALVFFQQLLPIALLYIPLILAMLSFFVTLFGVAGPREHRAYGSWWYLLSFSLEYLRLDWKETEGSYTFEYGHTDSPELRTLTYTYEVDGKVYKRSLNVISDRWMRHLRTNPKIRIFYFPDTPADGIILTGQLF
jgi:hypothetical protein